MGEAWGSTLTFSRRPLAEALASLAALGFRTVELGVLEGWAHLDPSRLVLAFEASARAVEAALAQTGLRVGALNAGLGPAEAPESWSRALAVFRLAQRLGARVVTLPAGPREEGLAAARRLGPLVHAAASHGVELAVETHLGAPTEDPRHAEALCARVPGLRLTLDPSHLVAGPAQGRGWEALLPHVAHVHLRDAGPGGWAEIQVWPGSGAVDFPGLARALAAGGYRGGAAVEYIDTLPVARAPEAGLGAAEAAAAMARLWRDAWP